MFNWTDLLPTTGVDISLLLLSVQLVNPRQKPVTRKGSNTLGSNFIITY